MAVDDQTAHRAMHVVRAEAGTGPRGRDDPAAACEGLARAHRRERGVLDRRDETGAVPTERSVGRDGMVVSLLSMVWDGELM